MSSPIALSESEQDVSAELEDPIGLSMSSVAIIIPSVVLGLLVFIIVGFYIWRCYTVHMEEKEAEKEKADENNEVKVPIAEEEEFPNVNSDIEDAS